MKRRNPCTSSLTSNLSESHSPATSSHLIPAGHEQLVRQTEISAQITTLLTPFIPLGPRRRRNRDNRVGGCLCVRALVCLCVCARPGLEIRQGVCPRAGKGSASAAAAVGMMSPGTRASFVSRAVAAGVRRVLFLHLN